MFESQSHRMLIAGELVDAPTSIDVINPASGKAFARAPRADAALLEKAVAAATDAFPVWSTMPWESRAALLRKLADALEAKSEEMARLLTLEQGKPLDLARFEVAQSVRIFRFYASMTLEPKLFRDSDRSLIVQERGALGVVAAITPWNFPLVLLVTKLAPALLAGNCVVAKPSPTTPLTTLLLGALAAPILPAGTMSTLVDDNDLGGLLTRHPAIAKIAFTGSTATGRRVMASAAETLKRLTLELGGNDAAIVLDDAPVGETATAIFHAAMLNSGQVCMAVKRVYVAAAIHDEFCDQLVQLANTAIVGDGLEQGTQFGPLQNAAQFARAKTLLDDCARDGTVIAGGSVLAREGYFIAPTIVRDVKSDSRIVCEEQFAPILPILRYVDVNDAVAQANASEFGLGASVWSADLDRAMSVAHRLQAGTVWINTHLELDPEVPFRGTKQSGLGTEFGREGLEEFTSAKIINTNRLSFA